MKLYNISTAGYGANDDKIKAIIDDVGLPNILSRLQVVGAGAFSYAVKCDNVPERDMLVLHELFGLMITIEFAGIATEEVQEAGRMIQHSLEAMQDLKKDLVGLLSETTRIDHLTVVNRSDVSAYNRVKVKENACTEEIDGLLQEGWRIVHVWKDYERHRRPSYILGLKEL